MPRKLSCAIPLLALCGAALGCIVVTDHSPPPAAVGSLTTYWTLDGSDDPDVCAFYGVDSVDVALYDRGDDLVVAAQPTCETFGVSFDRVLDDGYSLEVTLLDAAGTPVSDTVAMAVDVWTDEETVVDVDFPASFIY